MRARGILSTQFSFAAAVAAALVGSWLVADELLPPGRLVDIDAPVAEELVAPSNESDPWAEDEELPPSDEAIEDETLDEAVAEDSADVTEADSEAEFDEPAIEAATEADAVEDAGDAVELELPSEVTAANYNEPIDDLETSGSDPSQDGAGASADEPALDDDLTAATADGESPYAGEESVGDGATPDDVTGDDPTSQSLPPLTIEAAQFKGIQPGVTLRNEAEEILGEPKRVEEDGSIVRCTFDAPPFASLDIDFEEDRVRSLVIQLAEGIPVDSLATELGLDNFEPADVVDAQGKRIGLVYPERSVLLQLAEEGKAQQVARIILDEIDPEAFVVRAELRRFARPSDALEDLTRAIELNEGYAEARALKASLLLELGHPVQAREEANHATELEPESPAYRLVSAATLAAAGQYDEAAALAEQAAGEAAQQGLPHVEARAKFELGNYQAHGPQRNYRSALEQHLAAIKLAETLIADPRPEVAHDAREVLLVAHLAAASDIAWGGWKNKDRVVPEWIARASAVTNHWPEGPQRADARFRVARGALAAYAGCGPTPAAREWIAKLSRMGGERLEKCTDQGRRQQIEWDLGMALYDALQIEHARGAHTRALVHGQQAADILARAVANRDPMEGQAYVLGRLYFRIGAIMALQQHDHTAAVGWFHRAIPLLEEPIPHSAIADEGRQGESFVSMAVSFWEVGQRDEAVRLTAEGLTLMRQAVEDGIIEEVALGVPLKNLSNMHRALGNEQAASSFEQMAAKVRPATRR